MSTYRIVDLQSDETVAENQNIDDLQTFANDLFWQDTIDFAERNIEEVIAAICACDYDVVKE